MIYCLYIQLEFEVEIINDFKKILLEVTYSILDKNVISIYQLGAFNDLLNNNLKDIISYNDYKALFDINNTMYNEILDFRMNETKLLDIYSNYSNKQKLLNFKLKDISFY